MTLLIHKTGSTLRIATPPQEDRATASGDVQKKFGEVRPRGLRDMRADRQTHKLTDGTERPTDAMRRKRLSHSYVDFNFTRTNILRNIRYNATVEG